MSQKILFAFDFDHTIVDGNSDTIIRSHFLSDYRKPVHDENWTHYMQHIFEVLHQLKIGSSQMVAAIESLAPTNQMLSLLQYISRPDCEVIIISDANSFFINTWLNSKEVSSVVSQVYTNPAHFDSTGLLKIAMHDIQDSCNLCEKNLCKGEVLLKHVYERSLKNITFSKIIYVGDGRNDYCPSLKLSSSDLIFARSGFVLEKLLKKPIEEQPRNASIKAKVHVWSSAHEILSIVRQYFS